MLNKVKLALRLKTDAFDAELNDMIAAAYLDLGIAGVSNVAATDALIIRAVVTYCKMYFGQPSDGEFDRLKKAYDEQKAQLGMATGYTTWEATT